MAAVNTDGNEVIKKQLKRESSFGWNIEPTTEEEFMASNPEDEQGDE